MIPSSYQHPDLNDVPLSKAMAALADPCRLGIVRQLLAAGCELACHEFELPQSKATISHHFRTLREGGIIETRAEGNRCLNRVRGEDLEKRFPGLLSLLVAEIP